MIVFEAADLFVTVINRALLTVAVAAGLVALIVAVAVPLLVAPSTRWAWRAVRTRCAPVSRPQPVSCGSRGADTPPGPAQGRTELYAPSWARKDAA